MLLLWFSNSDLAYIAYTDRNWCLLQLPRAWVAEQGFPAQVVVGSQSFGEWVAFLQWDAYSSSLDLAEDVHGTFGELLREFWESCIGLVSLQLWGAQVWMNLEICSHFAWGMWLYYIHAVDVRWDWFSWHSLKFACSLNKHRLLFRRANSLTHSTCKKTWSGKIIGVAVRMCCIYRKQGVEWANTEQQ